MGVYGGFELCEAAALPDSEEYLDSRSTSYARGDWNRPGHIVGEITQLNRIRRANPALHTHLGITFLSAHNDQILCFEKATGGPATTSSSSRSISIRSTARARISNWRGTPSRTGKLHDQATLDVVDLMSDAHFQWHGPLAARAARFPAQKPFAIWRITPRRRPAAR